MSKQLISYLIDVGSRIQCLSLVCCIVLCSSTHGQMIGALGATERADVRLGTSKVEIIQKHPKMLKFPQEVQPGNLPPEVETYAELVMMPDGRVALWYHFKNDVLRGLSISRGFGPEQGGHLAQHLLSVYGHIDQNMTWMADEQTLRSNGLEGFAVTAEHWKGKNDGMELYLVATNQEVTAVYFDPTHLSRRDFLADPEWKARVDENGRRLRAKLPPEKLANNGKTPSVIKDAPRPFKPRTAALSSERPGLSAEPVELDSSPSKTAESKRTNGERSVGLLGNGAGNTGWGMILAAAIAVSAGFGLWRRAKNRN